MNEARISHTGILDPSVSPGEVGKSTGIVLKLIATAALVIGDAVFVSGVNSVNKSGTAANYLGFAGVVVGGALTKDSAFIGSDAIGTPAAGIGETVLVQISGTAWVKASTVVNAGAYVIPSATAGKLTSAATPTAGQALGIALTTSVIDGPLLLLIQHR